jgi:hypothetical protein
MERRKEQLKKMLEETKRRLADHDAGVEKLGEEVRWKEAMPRDHCLLNGFLTLQLLQ